MEYLEEPGQVVSDSDKEHSGGNVQMFPVAQQGCNVAILYQQQLTPPPQKKVSSVLRWVETLEASSALPSLETVLHPCLWR